MSIVLCDDARIQELNRQWRGKDRPTDVLSFPQEDGGSGFPPGAPAPLGDVVISIETARRQAEVAGATLEEEVTRLLIHGVLHLLGHDHVHGGHQARKMKAEETRLWRIVRRAGSRPPPRP